MRFLKIYLIFLRFGCFRGKMKGLVGVEDFFSNKYSWFRFVLVGVIGRRYVSRFSEVRGRGVKC